MTGFVALAPLIEPLIEQDWAQVPADIQAIWQGRIILFRWDELSPRQRMELALQQDYQHDPATEAEREAAFNLVTEVHDIQRQIRELELAPAHTAGDVIAKEDRLALLREKAATLNARFKHARGDDLPNATYKFPDCTADDAADTELETDEAELPSAINTEEPVYDPLPTDGIAAMFPLSRDDDENLERWRNLAHNAPRNGLADCRVATGSGKRQSTFDPASVGEWLVRKGKYTQAEVVRILQRNLPTRSAHLRDLLAP